MSALLICGVVAALLLVWSLALWRKLAASEELRAASERDAAILRRQMSQLQIQQHAEQQFTTNFFREFPQLVRELRSGDSERRIPGALLRIVTRILEPQQTLILLRRRRVETDPARASRMVVAAVSRDSKVKQGTEVTIGEGEIGFVAEVQRAMDRHDFNSQTAVRRNVLAQDPLPGFDLDIAAPMVVGEETVGVIAVSRPKHTSAVAKDVLRLVAQVGGLAVHNATAYGEMKVTADIDGLTRVFNKRHMTQLLGDELLAAQQQLTSLSIFMFDIDNFKHYNDANGHVAGDRLLQQLARLVADNTRKGNYFGRFGGEEFLLILPGVGWEQALSIAEKLRGIIASHPFAFAENQPLGAVTISGGVAEHPATASESTGLLRAADEALYAAKGRGRNRVLAAVPRYLREQESSLDLPSATGAPSPLQKVV